MTDKSVKKIRDLAAPRIARFMSRRETPIQLVAGLQVCHPRRDWWFINSPALRCRTTQNYV